jgi:hypothetical protein
MQRFAALVAAGLFVVSCSPEGEVTGSTNKCATTLHSSFNPKVLDQCVDVCINVTTVSSPLAPRHAP